MRPHICAPLTRGSEHTCRSCQRAPLGHPAGLLLLACEQTKADSCNWREVHACTVGGS